MMNSRFENFTPRQYYQLARRLMADWWDAGTIEERLAVEGALCEVPPQFQLAARQSPRPSLEASMKTYRAVILRITAHHTGRTL